MLTNSQSPSENIEAIVSDYFSQLDLTGIRRGIENDRFTQKEIGEKITLNIWKSESFMSFCKNHIGLSVKNLPQIKGANNEVKKIVLNKISEIK